MVTKKDTYSGVEHTLVKHSTEISEGGGSKEGSSAADKEEGKWETKMRNWAGAEMQVALDVRNTCTNLKLTGIATGGGGQPTGNSF